MEWKSQAHLHLPEMEVAAWPQLLGLVLNPEKTSLAPNPTLIVAL
jgi:hypothetical protein